MIISSGGLNLRDACKHRCASHAAGLCFGLFEAASRQFRFDLLARLFVARVPEEIILAARGIERLVWPFRVFGFGFVRIWVQTARMLSKQFYLEGKNMKIRITIYT